MRWAVGYTLHPGKSYLQCSVRIINRTPVANTMLCFANVAVHANDQYQVIFPPSTQYVTHHDKREFTTWPIATTRFNGVDFSRGVDVSWYKNHVNANSMFAWNYEDDFFAGYDHGKEAGTMSVADHHIVPGKKFWTWGNGPRGQMWDKILTDDDGPYIELMVGAYSDNQPDYSWLQPYETKSFEMHWYPFREIGGVKKANLDAAVNLEIADGKAKVAFCTTSARQSAHAVLKAGEKVLVRRENRHRSAEAVCENGNRDSRRNRRARFARLAHRRRQGACRVFAVTLESDTDAEPRGAARAPKTSKPSKSFTWPASGSSNFTLLARSRNRIGRRRCNAIPAIRE